MKTSAIVRMIIWSVVAVLLTGVLVWGLRAGSLISFSSWGKHKAGYTYGPACFDASEIDEVQVEWISGEVTILEGDEISFEETANRTLDQDEQLCYKMAGRTLSIIQTDRSYWFGSAPSKDLQLTLPSSLKTLKVEVVSANVTAEGRFAIDKTELETVSGDITVQALSSREIELDTVSGWARITLDEAPAEFKSDSVSGDVTLFWPAGEGFTAELETVSGNLESDFAVTSQKDRLIYEDGRAEIQGDSVSGSLHIRQK